MDDPTTPALPAGLPPEHQPYALSLDQPQVITLGESRSVSVENPTIARFWVPGKPVQQGSKSQNRHGHMYEDAKGHAKWRRTVSDVAMLYMRQHRMKPFTQARVWATYVFPRPKYHFRTNGEVKPRYAEALHLVYPDRDKLDRCLNDGLTQGGALVDDSVIYEGTSRKIYVNPNVPAPGCLVTIRP